MKLRTKILGGYGLILVFLILVWAWAVIHLYRLGRASDAILKENFNSILAAENMIDVMERQDSAALLLLLGYREEGTAQFRENEVEFIQWLAKAKGNITLPGEEGVLAAIEQGYRDYLALFAELQEALPLREKESRSFYHETLLPRFHEVRGACLRLREMNQKAMVEASKRAQRVSVQAIWSMSGAGVIAGGAGLLFSILLSGILVRPLLAMARATEQIAEGDYDVSLEDGTGDELGLLARQMMVMSHKLKAFHELNIGRLITEKRKGEAILRSIGDGLLVVNEQFEVIGVNPEAGRILGKPSEGIEGRHVFDLLRNQELYDHIRATAETGTPPALAPEQAVFNLGEEEPARYFRVTMTPVKSEVDKVQGVVLLFQDVTRLKELEHLKSEFVMTASHELRTPLTGIAMGIGLLEESAAEKLSKKERELLRAASEETGRLQALVNDLLDLSRLESGRMEMEMVPVPAILILEKVAAAFKTQLEAKGIAFTWKAPEDLPRLQADPTKITWVLGNLVSNALRYTEPGGHIRLQARASGGWAYLSVADDGAGIPQEFQSRIFDKFVLVKGDTRGGSGLGLSICREIVKAHGGTIWVESSPGKGSTFTFTLKTAEQNKHSQAKES
jgi:NtrC-family two-component system sensor histidine kinase KinB